MRNTSRTVAVFSSCLVAAMVVSLTGYVWAAGEPRDAAIEFGDVSVKLAMDKDKVIAALEPRFLLQMQEPDRDFPDLVNYSIHDRQSLPEAEPQSSQVGEITFKDGKVHKAWRYAMDGKQSLDSREMMIALTDLLAATSKKLDVAKPGVRWDDGKSDGRKTGNRELSFDYGLEHITVIYYDSPGGSQTVTLTVWIGED